MEREARITADKLLKSIRHSASGLFKSLPPERLAEEVQAVHDLCEKFLELVGAGKVKQ